jgi:CheY-like chemotaxis protein
MSETHVMVIDDSADFLMLMGMGLAGLGYDVTKCNDPQEGIAQAKELIPDVILLDLYMPGLDGFEVAKLLAQDERTRSIPIIILSAADDERFRKKSFDWGAEGYVAKRALHVDSYLGGADTEDVMPFVEKDKADFGLLKRTIDKVLGL